MAFQSTRDPAQGRLLLRTAILFIAYVCVAISLPIVPIYATEQLGLRNVWAGLGVGIAFLTTIVSRGHAGSLSDRRGAKYAVTLGLLFHAAGALISLSQGLAFHAPLVAYLGSHCRPSCRWADRPRIAGPVRFCQSDGDQRFCLALACWQCGPSPVSLRLPMPSARRTGA